MCVPTYVANALPNPGQTLDNPWTSPGPALDQPWTSPGPTLDQPWTNPGPTLDQPWNEEILNFRLTRGVTWAVLKLYDGNVGGLQKKQHQEIKCMW